MVLSADSARTVQERVARSAYSVSEHGLRKLSFHAMSTICRVQFEAANPAEAKALEKQILRWVGWFEAKYSRFIPDSLIGRINAAAGEHWVEVDSESEALFNLCQEMIFFTRGVFDPTALPLIRLWNWKAKPAVVPEPSAIAQARSHNEQRGSDLGGWRPPFCARGPPLRTYP